MLQLLWESKGMVQSVRRLGCVESVSVTSPNPVKDFMGNQSPSPVVVYAFSE